MQRAHLFLAHSLSSRNHVKAFEYDLLTNRQLHTFVARQLSWSQTFDYLQLSMLLVLCEQLLLDTSSMVFTHLHTLAYSLIMWLCGKRSHNEHWEMQPMPTKTHPAVKMEMYPQDENATQLRAGSSDC